MTQASLHFMEFGTQSSLFALRCTASKITMGAHARCTVRAGMMNRGTLPVGALVKGSALRAGPTLPFIASHVSLSTRSRMCTTYKTECQCIWSVLSVKRVYYQCVLCVVVPAAICDPECDHGTCTSPGVCR